MPGPNEFTFVVSTEDFDKELLPVQARTPGTDAFVKAVNEYLRKEFSGFGGKARFVVTDKAVEVTWSPDPKGQDPLEAAVALLRRGEYPRAVQTLEFLKSARPQDPTVLYNLGMALSDMGRLARAEEMLRSLVSVSPKEANNWVALGVVHARQKRWAEASKALQKALEIEPENPFALRNLGACLINSGDLEAAEKALSEATVMAPRDQQAWYGLAQVVHQRGDAERADELYRRTVEVEPSSEIAELARRGLSELAHETFRKRGAGVERPDAVMYLLSAIEKFDGMPQGEVQRIGFEVATLGMRGFDVNEPDQKYELRSLPGKFSGLHCVCLMYAAFQRIAPGTDIGFDLSREYQVALSLRRTGKTDDASS